jgi:glycosyltransferase involved in cell wall biosynthesis
VPPRIAVVVQGDPTSPRTWSGSPAGIVGGLRAHGVDVVPVDATPPGARRLRGALRRPWTWDATNPAVAIGSGLRADLALRRARVDGAVAIGSGFRLRTGKPIATFEDETVAQALRQTPSELAHLSPRESDRWLGRQAEIYSGARACCVGSDWAGASIRDDFGVAAEKVHVVGFGHNLAARPAERDWTVPRFLFLGVKWELKRGPAVLAAFEQVRARHPAATLDVAGGHPPFDQPGVRGHGLLSLASETDRAKLIDLLDRSTCLVLPSRREAFGIAFADAGSAGLPSIGGSVGGSAETIGDGGFVVDPGDDEALLSAMLHLCDGEVARELGEKAGAHAALFDWVAVAERILRSLALPGIDPNGLAGFISPRRAPLFTVSGPVRS